MTDHDRYDALALGHVLGGLDEAEAAEFRTHLLACRGCRRRVSELRGIAADLEHAEREERAQLRLKTETSASQPEPPPSGQRPWFLRPRVLAALAVGLTVVAAVMLYVLHLRTTNDTLLATTQVRENVLRELGQGTPLPAQLGGGVTGVVSADGVDVAFSLAGLPVLQRDEIVIVWRITDGDPTPAKSYQAAAVQEGLLADVFDATDADRIVISVEDRPADAPGEQVLVDVPLRRGG